MEIIMGDTTMEQKLRLVQQIRSRYNENQFDLSNREKVLYGFTSVKSPEAKWDTDTETAAEAPVEISFFKVRLFFAILLFFLFVFMDRNGLEMAGITTEKIYQAISADYEEKIDEWAENFAASYSK